ncbi:MAG: cyclic pyranopterin monophosphate synthase MoaC, partial [Planctomycetota bacterium]
LTSYDMCKGIDRAMIIESIRLESKSGGRSGEWSRASEASDSDTSK